MITGNRISGNQPILFDLTLAQKLAERGIAIAEANNLEGVGLARAVAYELARKNGEVTSDDIRKVFTSIGEPWIGNAAGAIFRDGAFEFSGRYIRSEVVVGHGNLIRVWRLKVQP